VGSTLWEVIKAIFGLWEVCYLVSGRIAVSPPKAGPRQNAASGQPSPVWLIKPTEVLGYSPLAATDGKNLLSRSLDLLGSKY